MMAMKTAPRALTSLHLCVIVLDVCPNNRTYSMYKTNNEACKMNFMSAKNEFFMNVFLILI